MNELHDKQTLAKRMLVQVLRLPDGAASRQVDALTEQQLEEVCQTSQLPLRVQREVLKAVMAVDCAPIASEPHQDPATPVPVTVDAPSDDPAVTPESPSQPGSDDTHATDGDDASSADARETPDSPVPPAEPLDQEAAPAQEEDQEPGEDPAELPDTDVVE